MLAKQHAVAFDEKELGFLHASFQRLQAQTKQTHNAIHNIMIVFPPHSTQHAPAFATVFAAVVAFM